MVKTRRLSIAFDVSPDTLGEFVTAKAYAAACYSPIENSAVNVATWSIMQQLPEVNKEWYKDAFEFFLSETIHSQIEGTTKMAMRPNWKFPRGY